MYMYLVSYFQSATVFASSMGFKVTVEDSKCVQANAFIQEALFHEFVMKEDQITFKINLTVLLVCIYTCINTVLPVTLS